MAETKSSSEEPTYPRFKVGFHPWPDKKVGFYTWANKIVYVRFVSSDSDPVEYNALSVVCPEPFRDGKITQKCRSLLIEVARHYARSLHKQIRIYFSQDSADIFDILRIRVAKKPSQFKYIHPERNIGTFKPLAVLNEPVPDPEPEEDDGEYIYHHYRLSKDTIEKIRAKNSAHSVEIADPQPDEGGGGNFEFDGVQNLLATYVECENCDASVELADPQSNKCADCGFEYDGDGNLITRYVECEKCSATVKLADPKSNRCPDCGFEYDGDGDCITGEVQCLECGSTVDLINQKSNECEGCGLKYDGNGDPVADEPPPGMYIGRQEGGGVGTSSMESYYVDCTDDGQWLVFHHGDHPGLLAEEGPYDAFELLDALEEFGFKREKIIEKRIKGLKAALKKKRPPSSGSQSPES